MTVKIELPDEQAAVLAAKAGEQGLALEDWLQKPAKQEAPASQRNKPLKSAYGLLAKYGPALSAEEIGAKPRRHVPRLRGRLLMIAAVADTHAAVWYLFGDLRLAVSAKTFIDQAASANRKVVLSVISLVEILYLIE